MVQRKMSVFYAYHYFWILILDDDIYFTYEITPFVQRKINKASSMLTKVGPSLTTDFFIELERKTFCTNNHRFRLISIRQVKSTF